MRVGWSDVKETKGALIVFFFFKKERKEGGIITAAKGEKHSVISLNDPTLFILYKNQPSLGCLTSALSLSFVAHRYHSITPLGLHLFYMSHPAADRSTSSWPPLCNQHVFPTSATSETLKAAFSGVIPTRGQFTVFSRQWGATSLPPSDPWRLYQSAKKLHL